MPQCFTIMNNDNNHNTIQEFDVNLICDFFLNTNRQGPGSPEATLKALSFINNLTVQSLIADLGCGTGGQTWYWHNIHREVLQDSTSFRNLLNASTGMPKS